MRCSSLLKKIGNNIRSYRTKKSHFVSQEEFAEKINMHRNHVGRIERGEVNISMSTLCKIADQLKVKPEDLLK